jgi:pilus assembly protein CpaB
MNRDRLLLGLGAALVVAFLATSYVYKTLQRAQTASAGKASNQIQVIVAAGPLKMGQLLTVDDLALLDWPEGKQPEGSLLHKEDAVGRALIGPMVKGEVILDQELAKRDEGAGLSVAIPHGMRAVSVGVDDIVAVAGFVTPGTIVDVLVTGAGPGGAVTRTILEHVRVLAVGQQVQTESGKPQTAPVVTLLVTPEDGEKLTLAAADGRIHLALRNMVDTADANPAPVYGSTIFMGSAPAAPVEATHAVVPKRAPAPTMAPQPFTVQTIRGDKVETQTFPR